jgi:hypothetical protein
MHTSRTMRTGEFEVRIEGLLGTFDEVLPNFTVSDRIAIVTHTPGGSLAAAPLLLAAIGRYYELLREERDEFYRYPNYFVVHLGRLQAYHGWIDVWPEHKEVVVNPDPEAVLEALLERGITRVLLESTPAASGEVMRESANWFLEDVADVLAFTPWQCEGPLTVRSSAAAAELVRGAVQASEKILPKEVAQRAIANADQCQAFERLTPLEALSRMCSYGPVPGDLGQSEEYLTQHNSDLAPHRFRVTAESR